MIALGDARDRDAYALIRHSPNRVQSIRRLSDEDVTAALAAASREQDPLVANFLATELMNRTLLGKAILESLPHAILTIDQGNRITLMNSQAEVLFRAMQESVIGHKLTSLLRLGSGNDRACFDTRLDAAHNVRGTGEGEFTVVLPGDEAASALWMSSAPLLVRRELRGSVMMMGRRGRPPPKLLPAGGELPRWTPSHPGTAHDLHGG